MKSIQILKQKINSETLTLGALVTHHLWVGMVEIAIKAGLDYLIIDLEHFTHDHGTVADACAVGRMVDFPIMIRPPSVETSTLHLAMDLGPCGLLIPYVQDAAMMDHIQHSIYLQPRGNRRPGGLSIRCASNLNYAGWREIEDDFIVLPQIENRHGLAHVEEIAAHPLTTAIAIGPYDLSADLGVCWQPEHPLLLEAVKRIRQAGRVVGKNMWHIGDPPTLIADGFSFLCIAEPLAVMESALKTMVQQARSGNTTATQSETPLP